MQAIEERAIATYQETLTIWLVRYVDDTFTIEHQHEINTFHQHLNVQNPDIQWHTNEFGENGKIPFLDCLVIRDSNKLRTTVYRKPTHTDRLLDQSSYNPASHKATAIKTLIRRVQLVWLTWQPIWRNQTPGTPFPEGKKKETITQIIKPYTHRNTEPDETTNNQQPDSCHNDYTLHQR